MQLLFVLIFIIATAIGAEYDYDYNQNVDEDLLSEIFQQSSFELHKTDSDYDNTELEENVRKKRLQLTHYSEQGNHFPVFDFDTKPKAKRTTAAPVAETTTTTESTELPPIKKFTFKILDNNTTTEAPTEVTEAAKEVSEEELEAENLVEPESENLEKSEKTEKSEKLEISEDKPEEEKSQDLSEKSPADEILEEGESIVSHGLPRINPAYLQVRHQGTSEKVTKADNEPSPYDKFTTPAPQVSTLPAFFTTPAPAYYGPPGPVYPHHGPVHGHVQVPHFKNFEYHPAYVPEHPYKSSIKYENGPETPAPAPVEMSEALRIPEEPQVPVFHTTNEEPAKEDPFAETLFPTTEPAIAKLVTQFTTPKPFISSLGANGQVTPAPATVEEGAAVVSALPPVSPYVPPYGPTAIPHHGLGPHGFSTPAPHFDLSHPQPGYGPPPAVPFPDPGYGVPGPVHALPDVGYGVPEPIHHLEPGYGVPEPVHHLPLHPEPGYGVPGPVHALPDPAYGVPHPEPGYGVPEPVHHLPLHPDPGYGVPGPVHALPDPAYGVPHPVHHPEPGYGVPEPLHHVSSLGPNPHHGLHHPHPEPAYGVPEPVVNDPAHPFHFTFSGAPEHPVHEVPVVPDHPVPVTPVGVFGTPTPVPVTPVGVFGTPTPVPGHPIHHGN